jgi:uncharacterized protein YdhG (YjbR/CyaY superfamily)
LSAVDEYIAGFPPKVRAILKRVRATIRKAAPGSEEVISYRMPAIRKNGRIVVYFAGFKNHIGMYPPVKGVKGTERYAGPKGNLKFPYDEPIPFALIARVVKARFHAVAPARKRQT